MFLSKKAQDRRVCIKFKFDQEKIDKWFEKYNKIRLKRKEILYHKQNKKCDVCSKEMWIVNHGSKPSKDRATIDHVIPVCNGGSDHWSNWTITCSDCNNLRGNQNYNKFKSNYESLISIRDAKNIKKNMPKELSEKDFERRITKIYYIALLCIFSNEYKNNVIKTLNEINLE